MAYADYRCLQVQLEHGVATITIDNPPINLITVACNQELDRLSRELEGDDDVSVVIFQSANPDFFLAHYDVSALLRRAGELRDRELPSSPEAAPVPLRPYHRMTERYRLMPKVTIAKIEGRAGGGGSEFLLALDLRFGALGRALLSQPEVALGITPGGGGTQRLPRLVGRSRALEIILGCDEFDAALAERYGYINRALPPEELGPFVTRLARRIAAFPRSAIALAKAAIAAAEPSVEPGLRVEADRFNDALATDVARERMARFLELGGQTHERELMLASLLADLGHSE